MAGGDWRSLVERAYWLRGQLAPGLVAAVVLEAGRVVLLLPGEPPAEALRELQQQVGDQAELRWDGGSCQAMDGGACNSTYDRD